MMDIMQSISNLKILTFKVVGTWIPIEIMIKCIYMMIMHGYVWVCVID
jgi:hypothetical protein